MLFGTLINYSGGQNTVAIDLIVRHVHTQLKKVIKLLIHKLIGLDKSGCQVYSFLISPQKHICGTH